MGQTGWEIEEASNHTMETFMAMSTNGGIVEDSNMTSEEFHDSRKLDKRDEQ
jgi:hypothetical protein